MEPIQRPLSGFETAFCLSEPPIPINFALIACFNDTPNEESLRKALTRLRERYPMAALRLIHDAHDEACFTNAGVPGFPLEVIENANAGDWRAITAQELGKNFNILQGPLLRGVLVKWNSGADLILTFHHGIADGMSAVFFL